MRFPKKLRQFTEQFAPNKRILHNVGFLALGEFVAKGLNFFILIYLVRAMSPELYGRYSLAYNLVMGFLFLIDLGMNTIVVRDGTRNPKRASELLSKVLTFKLYLGVLTVLLISAITLFVLPYDFGLKLLIISASVLVISKEVMNLINTSFRIVEQMKWVSLTRILDVLSFGIVVVPLLQVRATPSSIILAWIISQTITLAIQFGLSKKYIRYNVIARVDWAFCWRIVKQSFWIGIAAFLSTFYAKINIFMISVLISTTAVAYYTVAGQLVLGGSLIRQSISDAIFPNTCKSIRKKEYAPKLLRYIRVVSAASILGSIIITLFAKEILLLLFGTEYLPATLTLQISIWFLPFYIFNIWACQVLDSTNNQRFHVYNEIGILVLNTALNLLLIQKGGIAGAACAAVVARAIGTITLHLYAKRALRLLHEKKVDP